MYRCYEAYEAHKSTRVPGRGPGWDRADLAAHLYRQLLDGQYRGVRLDGMFRDEVQDFLMVGGKQHYVDGMKVTRYKIKDEMLEHRMQQTKCLDDTHTKNLVICQAID